MNKQQIVNDTDKKTYLKIYEKLKRLDPQNPRHNYKFFQCYYEAWITWQKSNGSYIWKSSYNGTADPVEAFKHGICLSPTKIESVLICNAKPPWIQMMKEEQNTLKCNTSASNQTANIKDL